MTTVGMWNIVTVVIISNFARALTFNGLGTDRAWRGNDFILDGSVQGRRIHG
jgi:uncharacterized protein (DUF1501 family)